MWNQTLILFLLAFKLKKISLLVSLKSNSKPYRFIKPCFSCDKNIYRQSHLHPYTNAHVHTPRKNQFSHNKNRRKPFVKAKINDHEYNICYQSTGGEAGWTNMPNSFALCLKSSRRMTITILTAHARNCVVGEWNISILFWKSHSKYAVCVNVCMCEGEEVVWITKWIHSWTETSHIPSNYMKIRGWLRRVGEEYSHICAQ